jgi:hypothetical protein
LLAYPVHGRGDAQTYPIGIDATAEQQERKLQGLIEHHSQMVLSGKRMRSLALSPERYMRVDPSARDKRLPWRPPAILKRWLRLLVVTTSGANDLCWSEAVIAGNRRTGYQLQPSAIPAASGPVFVKLHLDWPSPWIFDHWGWHAL